MSKKNHCHAAAGENKKKCRCRGLVRFLLGSSLLGVAALAVIYWIGRPAEQE